MSNIDILRQGIEDFGIEASDKMLADFQKYKEILVEWNQKMNLTGIEDEKDLPDFIVTAMHLNPYARIEMQSVWQKYIDASISSTINLPNSATVEDVFNIYMYAWKKGLKGITVYRDGCKRNGVLTNNETPKEEKEENQSIFTNSMYDMICPDCGEQITTSVGGCYICMNCGNSKC